MVPSIDDDFPEEVTMKNSPSAFHPGRRRFLAGSAAIAGISLIPTRGFSAGKLNFYNWDT